MGNGWSFAWRSYDAQYWGVPQRRLRIYAVLDLIDERAAEILFERESVRGDYATRHETGEKATADALGCADRSIGAWPVTARTLEARHDSSPCIDRGQNVVVQAAGFKAGQSGAGGIGYASEQMPTLAAEMSGTEPTTVYALQGTGIDRCDTAGCNGCGWREGESYTLTTIDRHGVCNGIDARNGCLNHETEPTIQAKANGGFSHNCIGPVLFDARGNGDGATAATVTGDHECRITDYTNIACYRMAAFGRYEHDETGSALKQRDYKDATDLVVSVAPPRRYIVRRLTPTECARLQGFPDWWGSIAEYDGDDAFWENVRKTHAEANGKQYRPSKNIRAWYGKLHTDASEYKMWGNGIALPCAEYVMKGIVEVTE